MKKTLIILSDYGLDDAVAGAYLFSRKDLFEKIYVVAVGGNTKATVSLENARKLLDAYGADEDFITLVSTDPNEQRFAALPTVHGGDGMGDLLDGVGAYPYIDFQNFLRLLSTEESDPKLKITVLSLGPLTVTKELMKVLPGAELVIMAGVVDEVPNFNDMEFNQALDHEAYRECVKNYPHVIATLDTCRNPAFNLAGIRLNGDKLINRLINRAIELAEERHGDNAFIYDFIASLYLTHPQIFSASVTEDRWGSLVNELKLSGGADFDLKDFVRNLK